MLFRSKTNKRIRIEVEHDYKKNIELTENRGLTSNDLNRLIAMINYSANESALIAARFMNNLRGLVNQSTPLELSPFNFMITFYKAVDDIPLAEELLKLLIPHGGIPRSTLTTDMRKAMKRVRSCGIIQYKRPIARHVISPKHLNKTNKMASNE